MSERPADRPADRTEITGPHQSDVYDVWEPAPHRARGVSVALIHGGFWRERYDRHHLAPLARALADDGFHVANLEYARAGMPGGGWPGTGASVLAQLTAVHADPARQRLTTPAVIVSGEHDDDVPASVIESYLATRTPDDPIHSAVALGADHFAVIEPQAPAYLLVLAEIEELTLATH